MPSVMGLLEEHERVARQRVEAFQLELREAEAVWERFVIARDNPRYGDGTIRITRWHKRPSPDGGREWCRTEVDYGLPGVDLRRPRLPSAPTA